MIPESIRSAAVLPRSNGACLLLGLALALGVVEGDAVIFKSTADPAYNTTAPGGALADSGWDLQGRWGSFLGTPIAPNLFITAKHVGVGANEPFVFRGMAYPVIDAFADPESDLRIFKVCGIFPEFAELYTTRNELGRSLVVFGRGTQRGQEVIGDSLTGPELKGWRWGNGDGLMRWGENVVATNLNTVAGVGELLGAAFDLTGGPNEAHLSAGDSGGAVFIADGGTWKLAGINYAVDGPFNNASSGSGFNAALYDRGGVYQAGTSSGTWTYVSDLPINQPSMFYATRISGRLAWINSVVTQHAVTSYPPVLQFTTVLGSPFVDHPSAVVDESSRTILIELPGESTYLRLRGCVPYTFDAWDVEGEDLLLRYTE